jgi:hypothetical protein
VQVCKKRTESASGTANTMPTTNDPVAFSGRFPEEIGDVPGDEAGQRLGRLGQVDDGDDAACAMSGVRVS